MLAINRSPEVNLRISMQAVNQASNRSTLELKNWGRRHQISKRGVPVAPEKVRVLREKNR